MAAASKKKSTKENDEVKDNAKNAESVFESNTKKGGRTGSSNVKKTVRPQSTASKTLDRKRKTADVNITHQRKIQDVTEYRDRLAFETGITLIVIGIVAVFRPWRYHRQNFWGTLLWNFWLDSMVCSGRNDTYIYFYDCK